MSGVGVARDVPFLERRPGNGNDASITENTNVIIGFTPSLSDDSQASGLVTILQFWQKALDETSDGDSQTYGVGGATIHPDCRQIISKLTVLGSLEAGSKSLRLGILAV